MAALAKSPETWLVCGECDVRLRALGAETDPEVTSIGYGTGCQAHDVSRPQAPATSAVRGSPGMIVVSLLAAVPLPSGDPTIDAYTGIAPPAPWADAGLIAAPAMSETEIVTRLVCVWTAEDRGAAAEVSVKAAVRVARLILAETKGR